MALFNRILKTGKYRGDLQMVIYSDIFMCVSDLALFVCTVFSGFIWTYHAFDLTRLHGWGTEEQTGNVC